jgi:hypothetical protein
LIWNQEHLLHALREFDQFYNGQRPHQGVANAVGSARIYQAMSRVEYKPKWNPTVILPEYFAFDGAISPHSLWRLAE